MSVKNHILKALHWECSKDTRDLFDLSKLGMFRNRCIRYLEHVILKQI